MRFYEVNSLVNQTNLRAAIYTLNFFYFKHLIKSNKYIRLSSLIFSNRKFFFKKFIFFSKLRFSKDLFNTLDIRNSSSYFMFFSQKFLFNSSIATSGKIAMLDKPLNFKLFNLLGLCSNFVNSRVQLSNYNLLLLKHYLAKFDKFELNSSGALIDLKAVSKKFVFFEFFLKKFLEKMISRRIFLTFVRNDIDFLLNNQYYLMFIKRVKKLQIFNKDINLVRELVEVLVITMYTHDVICFKN
jgi:hypothetical protein